jgi:hypothetical protein
MRFIKFIFFTALLIFLTALAPAATIQPLETSPIVSRDPDGTLGVARKDGTPINGLKLSQYDALIQTPGLAVASDGTIHLAFIEQQAASPFVSFVFHRQSTDGGKTWSDPKNLSEDMPSVQVGFSSIMIDSSDRVYVIWRTGLDQYTGPRIGQNINLVYRVLDHGKWSKILPINQPATPATYNSGAIFPFAVIDAAGHAQVIWNSDPNTFLPAQVQANGHSFSLPDIGNGLVFQATLDGTAHAAPRQIYMAALSTNAAFGEYGKICDDYGVLDGYADANGAAHFIALVRPMRGGDNTSHFNLFEDGKQTPAVSLPSSYMETWGNPPKLLVDAQGRRHIIAFYTAGEHPSFRDYLVGSDDEPTVILAAKPPGTCMGFQAWQGTGGRMAVVMQTTERGYNDSGDTWLTTSDGTKWSPLVCVTDNAARARWVAKQRGSNLLVATGAHYGPGPGAMAFDKDGHVLLALINVKTGSFALANGGVTYAGGSTATPMLFFYKF